MEFFRIKKDIPFMRYALILNAISLITFLAADFFLWQKGLNLSIEFTGGSVIEVQYDQAADLASVRNDVSSLGYGEVNVQNFGSSKDVMIRLPLIKNVDGSMMSSADQSKAVITKLQESNATVRLQRVEYVGPQVGEELLYGGIKALLFVIIGIVIYLSIRFEWKFALAGIIANLHDVVIILGFFAFFQWEFSLSVLAAVLAVLGYSVNESVVIFDRIRENFRRFGKLETPQIIDGAITSTMSRTIITHGSTQMMVLSMLLFGGATLHYFAVALTIGILFGIYSSVFVAAAIAMWLGVTRGDLLKASSKEERSKAKREDPNYGAKV
jgi:preprotein translocase subunit SecF